MSTRRQHVVTADQWGKPERDEHGTPICRWCRGSVTPPRRTFCGDACVHEWKIRSSPWYVRREVKRRDKGICRICGLNVVQAHREWSRRKPPVGDRAARRAWRAERPRWEADHIVPVADGGGECGLENYRLLCRPCHVRVTAEWRAISRRTFFGRLRLEIREDGLEIAAAESTAGPDVKPAVDGTGRRD